ncbi:MAG TPA: TatD family hydrolase [Baekduia sp.]|nr:TatD family hydrolase [Baekduia sp.]
MIDSHTHLDFCDEPNAALVKQARAAGVTRMLTIGTEPESCRAALTAAAEFDDVYAAVGRHPNAVEGFDIAALNEIEELARHEKCVAIGETGLDYYRQGAPPADQLHAFEGHIEIARALGKPLVVHTRAADDDTLSTLAERATGLAVIIHCFSMPDRLEECVEREYMISFAGNVTYKNSAELAAAAARVPDQQLLVETDAPYLTPQVVRKQRNRPEFVAHTAAFVAAQRGQSYEELEAIVDANAARLFGW